MLKSFKDIKLNEDTHFGLRFKIVLIVLILIVLNILFNIIYFRIDLTDDKKFSLSQATLNLLKQNKEKIYIKCYLEGDLESGFLRLKNSTKDILSEYKSRSNGNIDFDFINPLPDGITNEEKLKIFQDIAQMGLMPTNLKVKSENNYIEKHIIPGMIISIGGKNLPVEILENQIGYSPEEALNNSAIALEYKISNAIKKLAFEQTYNISFLQGHGEFNRLEVESFVKEMSKNRYNINFNTIEKPLISNIGDTLLPMEDKKIDLLIVANPRTNLSEYEKFRLDQYIMNGGKIMWLIDAIDADNSYLQNESMMFMSKSLDLNIDELLFKYGVRINKNLVQDAQLSASIPIIDNSTKEPMLFPWLYTPLLTPSSQHPISKNLDPVLSSYPSSIDYIENDIQKSLILSTSVSGRALPDPVRIHLSSIKEKNDPNYFKQPNLKVGVLLEGKFTSIYKNRLNSEFIKKLQSIGINTIDNSKDNKMIVISDANIISNKISSKGQIYPLGYDLYNNQIFSNMDFLKNCVEYLVDKNGLISARNKNIQIRLLDKTKINDNKEKWQFINLILPLVFIIILSVAYTYFRKRKWS